MAKPVPVSPLRQLRQRLLAYRWRRVGWLAGISLGLSLLLVGYLFGVDDQFLTRLLTAFVVSFWLLAVTFLAVIPFVGWAARHWFGSGWNGPLDAPAPPRRASAAPRPVAAGRRSSPSAIP